MLSKASLTAMTAAGFFAVTAMVAATPCLAQTAPNASTTTIEHGSDKARTMKEPSYQTREQRLAAKPLNWNSTLGKPKTRVLTDEERKALENAKPQSLAGGKPDPKAEAEARRLHPDDWK